MLQRAPLKVEKRAVMLRTSLQTKKLEEVV